MKTFIVLVFCVVAALSAPAEAPMKSELDTAPSLLYDEVRDDEGQLEIRYVAPDGTVYIQRAHFVPNANGTDKVLIYEGQYSFIGTDGKTYTVNYASDLNGFQASGVHLPTPVSELEPRPIS